MTNPMRTSSYGRVLEHALGDPLDPATAFSFRRILEADEAEAHPADAFSSLAAHRLNVCCVPIEHGGALDSYEGLAWVTRTLARRDLTTAFSYALNTFLGAEPVWVGGSPEQAAQLARRILDDGALVSIGFSERHHGADLLSSEVRAEPVEGGFRLSGAKWTIGNATRGQLLTVFARTAAAGGARGFSIFLIDKAALLADSYSCSPKIKTMGLRGGDVSGIELNGCLVPPEALVGALGAGLELTLRSFQISRALSPALSLGAFDTVLRSATTWLRGRQLYGASALGIGSVQAALSEGLAFALIGEAVLLSSARALHLAPKQANVSSAICKFIVPALVDQVLPGVTMAMGARSFMREGHADGIVQKMVRDLPVAGFGHGSAAVNLNMIAMQQRGLLRRRPRVVDAGSLELARALVDFEAQLPPLEMARLGPVSSSNCFVAALPALRGLVEGLEGAEPTRSELLNRLERVEAMLEELTAESALTMRSQSPEQYSVAARYARVHACLCAVTTWLSWRDKPNAIDSYRSGEWLLLGIDGLLFDRRDGPRQWQWVDRTYSLLRTLTDDHRLYSAVEWGLPHQ